MREAAVLGENSGPAGGGCLIVLMSLSSQFEPCGYSWEDLKRLSDEELMAHMQAGHADVLAIIFDRHYRLVLSVAMKILRDVGEAEDLMQTVFLEIFKAAAQFDPTRGTLKVWLLQYAYHRSINRRRYLNVRHFYKSEDIAGVENELSLPVGTLLDGHEARQLVTMALSGLNERQSTVLKLAYFEGLSLREISDRTQEPLSTVRHHYYRGLSKLREVLAEQTGDARLLLRKQKHADASA